MGKAKYYPCRWCGFKKTPADKVFCSRCIGKLRDYSGPQTISSKPEYFGIADRMFDPSRKGDPEYETSVAEKAKAIKNDVLAKDPVARRYEEARNKAWQAEKANWVKRGRNTKELSDMAKSL